MFSCFGSPADELHFCLCFQLGMEQESNEYDEYFHYVMEAKRLFYPDTPDQSLPFTKDI